ncbi:hypothetical protein BABINDRAFT_13262 [Babjeviella inositovora NRRL Y-12698]|uniref:Transcription factor IIIC subunit 5 HTH domain-containing protein n=1 Tax=Babjeviella inositovora NRRL Y-12698 TaxID=984486 RepID=A0A1E3QTS0_9ASCO|nr:uncharacterized protein BABINDRAFT_13262 [Babjeviella inositovora NRRL Y-12698]ODQ80412.1 hypothetical protein BABINDRAFT_13262 [Babjeviella inositovora NRRL Y-12698]
MAPKPAKKHSLDVPHLTALELPLKVRNVDKATGLLGGQQRIAKAIQNPKMNPLELRLRSAKDPYHHPLTGLVNTQKQKILLKVSIPKAQLTTENKAALAGLRISEVLGNIQNPHTVKIEPIAIIDRNFQFREMADFQYITRNDALTQQVKETVFAGDLVKIKEFTQEIFNSTHDPHENYTNKNISLPPPCRFSHTNVPHNYQYKKNPAIQVVNDQGKLKLVSKTRRIKLYTLIVNILGPTPQTPHPELVKKYRQLVEMRTDPSAGDDKLHAKSLQTLECIELLRDLFEQKPVWIRRQLNAVVPEKMRSVLKYALPHLSYIMRKGPWRQTYIKFGVDPRVDPAFWKYQSESFRLLGFFHKIAVTSRSQAGGEAGETDPKEAEKVVQNTLDTSYESDDWSKSKLVPLPTYAHAVIPEDLVFTGEKLPATLTFQIGDVLDPMVRAQLLTNPGAPTLALKPKMLSLTCHLAADGWIDCHAMDIVRKIIRYKLKRMLYDLPIEEKVLSSILATKAGEGHDDDDEEGDMDEEVVEEEDEEDEEEDEDEQESLQKVIPGVDEDEEADEAPIANVFEETGTKEEDDEDFNEQDIMTRLKKVNPEAAQKLAQLAGLLKHEDLM